MAFDVFLKCRGIYDQAYSVKDLDEELEKPPVWTRSQLPAHLLRATLVQPLAIRLCQPARRVHQGGSCTHQCRPCPNHRQMNLCFRAAMPHRPQQLRIDSGQPCQCPRIVAIIFSSALGDQIHLLRVRHEHFVSQLL